MILKHTAYTIRLDETVIFKKYIDKEGKPSITFQVDGKDIFSLKGPECIRLLESLQDALRKHLEGKI
jgi:hypothetical protein